MAKRSAKIAVTYFVTIICALGIIGGAGYFALKKVMNSESDMDKLNPEAEITLANPDGEYVPEQGYGQTALFICEYERKASSVCFVMTRFVPYENKLVVVPLQSDICTVSGGKTNTLYEFYRLGGTAEAVKAVEAATGITVDKYMKFTNESFTVFSDYMGNIDYEVPYNLVYENEETGDSTVIKAGVHTLDSAMLGKLLTFPEYRGGEEYRAKVVGAIVVSLINSGAKGYLKTGRENVFTSIVNSDVETNITKYDYEDLEPAFGYVLDNTNTPAQLVIPSGIYNENNCYVLDDSFLVALPRWFSME
ncbi:MAG: LCP family protein [Oscillospiraceae bacterium]|nr:LCP family protein [Oscillospiraceae bacterium]